MIYHLKVKFRLILSFILCFVPKTALHAKPVEMHPEIMLPIGNFSLPYSQQPWPLVSFGQNILDQGVMQLAVDSIAYLGGSNVYTIVDPYFIYGITDDFSLLLSMPISPQNIANSSHSFGLNDVTMQFEYAFYNYEKKISAHTATIVGNLTFPSGSANKNPPTGFGSMSVFLGATYNYTGLYWFSFASSGAVLTTNWLGKREFGNQFLYQFGFGRSIPSPKKTIFAAVLEFDGTYTSKNKIDGLQNPNSGSNIIYLTPSLSASTEHLLFQAGIGYPIIQTLNGTQLKYFWSPEINFMYTF